MTVFLWSRDFEKHLKSDVLCIFLKQKIVLQSSGRWRKCIRIMLITCLMKSANLTDCCCNMQMETWWQLQLQSRPEVMRNSTACCSLWNALLALLFSSWEYEHESFLIWHPSSPSRKLIYLWYFCFGNPEEQHALPAWNPALHVRASCTTCCVVWYKKPADSSY